LAVNVAAIVGGGKPAATAAAAELDIPPILPDVNVGHPQLALGLLHTPQLGFLGAAHPHFGFD
jgi:hypothetical protein